MRIAVAMSGGVDSSVAALLLAREGADVVGLSMHLWDHDRDGTGAGEGRCCTLDDLNVARRAADAIGIPHYVVNLEARFRDAVVRPFVESWLRGETPVPCASCNTDVKFDALLARAEALGCEAVATGHYARTDRDPETGEPRLLRARDRRKDQTYFLYDLTPEQLARARFPLGSMSKESVRETARDAGLPNWDKPDSQEVCFVPAAGHEAFVRREAEGLGLSLPAFSSARPGLVTDEAGRVLGSHDGAFPFTVGQRRGLGVATGAPLYVLQVVSEEGRVVVGPGERLQSREATLRGVNLVSGRPLDEPKKVLARVRYRHVEQPAILEPVDGPVVRGGRARLRFEEDVRAIAPGQVSLFFDAAAPDVVLGGGIVSSPSPSPSKASS